MNVGKAYNFHSSVKRFFHTVIRTEAQSRGNVAQQTRNADLNIAVVVGICRFFVGDGFIRPEVRTFVNLGRVTCINAERGNLGTDKSVPYNGIEVLSM